MADFVAWLSQFECCATSSNCDAAAKLPKLPAFLHGPVAAYFHSLKNVQKDIYANIGEFLHVRLCCAGLGLIITEKTLRH